MRRRWSGLLLFWHTLWRALPVVLLAGGAGVVRASPPSAPRMIRLALLIGHNRAGGELSDLRFAVRDAQKMRDVLVQMSGYAPRNVVLLKQPTAARVQRAFRALNRRIQRLRKAHKGAAVFLLVYYSGHARKGQFLLGKTRLRFAVLLRWMKQTGASLRLAILDACDTGSLTLRKGLRRRKQGFAVPYLHLSPTAQGEVIITATGNNESAHEDPSLRGGIFTHFWITGLRGAADRDRDGHVTLEEAYRYAYARTLERTILSIHGPQRAHFRKKIAGFGQLVLATIQRPQAWLMLRANVNGRFFVWNQRRDMLMAELRKKKGRSTTIALAPGRYVLQWRRRGGVYASTVSLRKGQRLTVGLRGREVAYRKRAVARGTTPSNARVDTLVPFRGQMEGDALAVSYQIGWSGVVEGMLHQGPSVLWLHPTPWMEGRFGWMVRLGYQWGQTSPDASFPYQMHLLPLETGPYWWLLRRTHWQWSLGLRLRVTPLLQVIPSQRVRTGDTILSAMLGAGVVSHLQIGFLRRWFVALDLDAGVRLLPLGPRWEARWTLAGSVGLGVRFP